MLAENWYDIVPDLPPAGSLTILLGAGDGTFVPGAAYPTGAFPLALVAADLNGDGFQDLAVTNGCGSTCNEWGGLSVYLGSGDGTFAPPLPVAGGDRPWAIAAGDFDHDGRRELAVGNRRLYYDGIAGDLSTLLGNGDGTFQPRQVRLLTLDTASVAVGDLNHDGTDDIVVADVGDYLPDQRGGLDVLLGRADGTFDPPASYPAGVGPIDVRIGHFNGDGAVDLAAANNSNDESLHLGAGNGTFQRAQRFGLLGLPQSVINRDFNSDGHPDLLVATSAGIFLLDNLTPLVVNATVSITTRPGSKMKKVQRNTTSETNLKGFNILLSNGGGHVTQINSTLIACQQCVTGLGAFCVYTLPGHKTRQDLLIEAVHLDGTTERFGPVMMHLKGATPKPAVTPLPVSPVRAAPFAPQPITRR